MDDPAKGDLLYRDLEQTYLDTAQKALDNPIPEHCAAAADAAYALACRYTSMDMLWRYMGGSPREAAAGTQLFTRVFAYQSRAGRGVAT